MFLGWPFWKFRPKILIPQKTWLWWMGATCSMAMKKFFKVLVLWNNWSDFEIISQKRLLDDPFQNMFAKLLFVKKHGSGDRGYLHRTDMKKLLKKSNRKSDFKIISQICSLDDPFENFLPKFWYLKKHGCDEGGYLHYMEMKKKILLLWNH